MFNSALNILICPTTLPSHGRGHKFEPCTAHQVRLYGSTPLTGDEQDSLK